MSQDQDAGSIRVQRRLHSLFTGLWLRRRMIIIPALIMPVVGFVIAMISTKNYLTYTSILIQEPALFNPFLEDLAVSTNLEDRMPALKALVHSRHVLSEVGIELGHLKEDSALGAVEYYVAVLGRKLSVSLVGTDLVKIYLRDTEPKTMAKTLETVTTQMIEQIVAPERSSLSGSESFLRDQLDLRHAALKQSETRLADYKSANSDKLPELHQSNLDQSNRLKYLLVEKQSELAGARAQLAASRQKLTQTNPLLGQLEKEIIEIQSQLTALRASYTDQHSSVRGLSRRLEHLDAERRRVIKDAKPLNPEELDRLWNMLSSPEAPTSAESGALSQSSSQQSLLYLQLESLHIASQREKSLVREVENLRQSLQEVEARITAYGETEMHLRELQRDLEVQQKIYNNLLERWELAQVTRALGDYEAGERIKIIDRPYTPSAPTNLPWIIFVIAGLIGGLFAGAGLAFVLEVTDTHVKRRDEVTELTGLSVLVRVPQIS